MAKYKPIGDKVVIQPEKVELKTKGGLHLPEVAHKSFLCKGEVLAVGRGLRLQDGKLAPLEIEVGMVVMFDRRVGEALTEGPDAVRVVREHEILAVVNE